MGASVIIAKRTMLTWYRDVMMSVKTGAVAERWRERKREREKMVVVVVQ